MRRVLLWLSFLPFGCVTPLSEEQPRAGELREDCRVESADETVELSAPVSVPFEAETLWVFPLLARGQGVLARVGARVPNVLRACDEPLELLADDEGQPLELLSLTEEERADNDTRTDGARLELIPTAGVVVEEQGYLFHDEQLIASGGDWQRLGSGLCRFDEAGRSCERLTRGATGARLFGPTGLHPVSALTTRSYVYILSCTALAAFDHVCVLARVAPQSLGDPSAYRFATLDGFVPEMSRAVAVTHALGSLSLRNVSGEGGPSLVVIDPFDSRVSVHSARSWGEPFEHPRVLFRARPPAVGELLGGGTLELGPGTGQEREIVISYATSHPGQAGLHLASFELLEAL
jgi:hypothetical protein